MLHRYSVCIIEYETHMLIVIIDLQIIFQTTKETRMSELILATRRKTQGASSGYLPTFYS